MMHSAVWVLLLASTLELAGCENRSPGHGREDRIGVNHRLLLDAADALRAHGASDAIDTLRNLVSADPYNYHAYYLLGVAQFETGDFKAAEQSWLKAIQINHRFGWAYAALGRLKAAQKDSVSSTDYFWKAIRFDSEHVQLDCPEDERASGSTENPDDKGLPEAPVSGNSENAPDAPHKLSPCGNPEILPEPFKRVVLEVEPQHYRPMNNLVAE